MHKYVFIVLILAGSLFGSTLSPREAMAKDAAPSGDAALAALAQEHYRAEWQAFPAGSPTGDSATAIGVHDYDDQFGSYTAADFSRAITRLHATLARVLAVPQDTLSLDGQIDRSILATAIKEELFALETSPEWRRSPRFYVELGSNGIFAIMARNFAPPPERLRLVIARERQIPKMLLQGEANLRPSQIPAIWAKLADLGAIGGIDFFEHDVPEAFASVKDAQLQAQFRTTNSAVIAALKQYDVFVKRRIVPQAHASYALGPATYAYLERLQNVVDIPLPKLLAVGEAALARDNAKLIATAKRIDPSRSTQAVIAELVRDHPRNDQLLATAQGQLRGLVAFIKAKHIIDLPDAPIAKVIPTPKFEAQLSFASIDTPGPLEKRATEAFYAISLADPSAPKAEIEQHLTLFNRPQLLIISAHEAYPGHYVNYLFNKRAHLSLIRSLEWNPAFGEGWAHYGEQMMVDEGLGGRDPRVRLAQLVEATLRECRYVVGIKEHTQGMSIDQATRFFMQNSFVSHDVAFRESVRGTVDPLYGYYTLGKLMILKLRSDYKTKMGANYTLAKFHDAFLSHGDPPLYYVRKLLLGPSDTGSLL